MTYEQLIEALAPSLRRVVASAICNGLQIEPEALHLLGQCDPALQASVCGALDIRNGSTRTIDYARMVELIGACGYLRKAGAQ